MLDELKDSLDGIDFYEESETDQAAKYNGNGGDATGDALVIDSCGGEYETPVVSVTNGTFTSAKGSAVASYAAEGQKAIAGFVSGGVFSSAVAEDLCAEGFGPTDNGNGTYGVHQHVAGEPVVENNVAPDCDTEGSYDNVVYCTVCGEELSRTTVTVPATGEHVDSNDDGLCDNCGEQVGCTHTAAGAVIENIVNGTMETKPQYDSVVYCTDCGHEVSRETIVLNDNVFAGMTMALNDSLEVKFVVYNSLVPEGAYAVIRRTYSDGTADDIVTMGQDKWVVYTSAMDAFAYNNLAACHMIDMFYVTLYNAEGEIIGVYTDSMRDYAMRKLVENEMKGNEKGKTLFVDMLNYGAAAQTRFNYATNDLANNRLTETQQGYATPEQIGSDNRVLGVGCMGTTLSLESRIELNFVFEKQVVTQDMYAIVTYTTVKGETVSVRIEGSEFVEYTASSWRVTLGMPLVEGMQMVSCTIYSGDTVITSAQDSMEGYLARKYDSGAIMAATWKFIQSASAFFAK